MSLLSALLATRLLASEGAEEATRTNADDPCAALVVAGDPYALAEPKRVEHKVTPGETVASVAARFHVDPSEVKADNAIDPWVRRLAPGKKLRINARRLPPPRKRIAHRVARGDTWTSIAIVHQVPSRMLQAYNWKKKKLSTGDEIVVWIDPGWPRTLHPADGDIELPAFDLPSGGDSIGRPQRGRIKKPQQLPESACYVRGKPERMWGSRHTIAQLQTAIARLRFSAGYTGPIHVGAISREGGGKFPPHKSHQSGRDVDIRLPLLPGFAPRSSPHPDEVDWVAAWALVDALLQGGEVAVIFLERKLQRRLYEAARWQGVEHERLAAILQWLDPERLGTIVRHSDGHDGHVHVRFRCAAHETRCRG